MSITKTGISVETSGARQVDFELDGQQSAVTATGLEASTVYDVTAYIIDSQWGRINSIPSSFSTLQPGTATFSNVTGTWGTSEARLEFSANWATTYNVPAEATNFQITVSAVEDFSISTTVNANFSRQSDGRSGTISYWLTANIPVGGMGYYVRIQLTDVYGEVLRSQDYTFTVPSQNQGYMSFTSSQQSTYRWWFHSTIYSQQFTYAPRYKRMVWSDDNWSSNHTGQNYNWPDNVEMFVDFKPGSWSVEMEVLDIYGNVFKTNQQSTVTITKPILEVEDTHREGMNYIVWVNRSLNYTAAQLDWTTQGGSNGREDLMPVTGAYISGTITNLPDDEYTVTVKVVWPNDSDESNTETILLEKQGYIELTDNSVFSGDILQWKASYVSGFDMVQGKIEVWDENDVDMFGEVAVVVDGTDIGDMWVDSGIQVAGDKVIIRFEGEDANGYTVMDEYILETGL